MLRIYQRLLQLYPGTHRRNFEDEMSAVFEELCGDVATKALATRLLFYVREGSGLLFGAFREHWRQSGIRRFSMQGEFRFPKATWILMTIILAGVVTAIEKGEAISASYSRLNPPAGPSYVPGQHALLSGIAESFLVIYGLGLLVWAVAFVLRRSEAH